MNAGPAPTTGPGRALVAIGVFALVAIVTSPARGGAQTFEGRVIDERDERPVPTALVRLVDEDGENRGVAIADENGGYRISAPGPGVYRLEAARLGYENFETPLLDAGADDGRYRIDLLLRPAPVALPGFTVETDAVPDEVVDQSIRLILGLSVASLRYRPIRRAEIQRNIEMGRGLEGALRWSNNAGLIVERTADGPCFSLRARGCLPIYLNGLRLNRDFIVDVPLDMLDAIVVVTPTDGSLAYPAGAILLFTDAWLR